MIVSGCTVWRHLKLVCVIAGGIKPWMRQDEIYREFSIIFTEKLQDVYVAIFVQILIIFHCSGYIGNL